jgi:hypothetical protein
VYNLALMANCQRKMPNNGASLATSRLLKKGKEGMQAKLGITGLTGPGEVWFNNSVGLGAGGNPYAEAGSVRLNVRGAGGASVGGEAEEDDDEELRRKSLMPSVFSELREAEEGEQEDEVGGTVAMLAVVPCA